MSRTKRQLVEQAYGELALAGYVFDLQPEEMQTGLWRLDAMMAGWLGRAVDVGYVFEDGAGNSDLDQASGLPALAVEAVYLNLAVLLAAGLGKALPPSSTVRARQAYDALVAWLAVAQLAGFARPRRCRVSSPLFPAPAPSPAPAPTPSDALLLETGNSLVTEAGEELLVEA